MSRESKMVTLRKDETGNPTVWCDPEIADLVDALNNENLSTIASCSGHGHRPGTIKLQDGRWLIVARNDSDFKRINHIFPVDINGDIRSSAAIDCPMCNSPPYPKPHKCEIRGAGKMRQMFRVCCGCGVTGPKGDTPLEALGLWNTRAPTEAERLQWRDIESAPKDGTPILVLCPNKRMVVASRNNPSSRTDELLSIPGRYQVAATHWIPLPAAPDTYLGNQND